MNPNLVRVDPKMLTAAAVDGLLDEFATRDGTDYGETEVPLAAKSATLKTMLHRGEVTIMFDPENETITLVETEALEAAPSPDAG